jgi:hypothetical protein
MLNVNVRAVAALVFSAALLLPQAARAWVPHTATVAAVKTQTPPKIDPSLSDPVWKTGVVFEDFFDFTVGRAAELKTVGYLLYDGTNIYFAVHCEQHGTPITASQTVDHVGVQNDDHVTLGFETSGNGGRLYEFLVNPHGIHAEYSSENARYAPDWQSVATVLPDGSWNAVMVIPLKDIRAQSGSSQTWQLNVERYIVASRGAYTWAYEPAMSSVDSTSNWPKITGIELAAAATRPKPQAQIYALGAAGEDRNVFQNGIGNFQQEQQRPVGIDFTIPVTNTAAFVGTLNPDFSNVEQDQTTIAPQEFARFYNEYRPFFSQGANYINSVAGVNINSADVPFYSPSIGIFDHGFKFEGTHGLNSLGILTDGGPGFSDSAFGYGFSHPDGSLGIALQGVDADHYGVRDETYGASVAVANPRDGIFQLVKYLSDRGTNVDDPSQANDFQVGTGVQNAHTLLLFKYEDIGPEYNPIDGYLTENDVNGPQVFYQYSGSGPKGGAIKQYQILAGADRFVDRSGAAHQSDVFSNLSVTFKNLVTLQYGQSTSELRVYADAFPVYSGAQVIPFNSQAVSFGYEDGTPHPVDLNYSWGPYANSETEPVYVQQPSISTSDQFGRWGVGLQYNGVIERALPGSAAPGVDSQWLRSISLSRTFGSNTTLAIALRGVNGNGGFATPGTNLALGFHERFRNLDELYFDYGSPASATTLNRFLLKYIFHVGGQTGT